MYDASKPDFFTVQGNIYIGEKGGIVGENISKNELEQVIINSSHYCFGCLTAILQEATTQPRGGKTVSQVLTESTPPKFEKTVSSPKTVSNKRATDDTF
jgi:hypothetical protein